MGCLISTDYQLLDAPSSSVKVSAKLQIETQMTADAPDPVTPRHPNPLEKYHISPRVLGAGGFGKVFLARSVDDPSISFAIKALNKRNSKMRFVDVNKEIGFLK